MDYALEAPSFINVPVMYLYGEKDEIVPKGPTEKAMTLFEAAHKNMQAAYYEDSWHMILRDKAAPIVLRDIIAFIGNALSPLPSGADQHSLQRLRTDMSN